MRGQERAAEARAREATEDVDVRAAVVAVDREAVVSMNEATRPRGHDVAVRHDIVDAGLAKAELAWSALVPVPCPSMTGGP